jgi:integrase
MGLGALAKTTLAEALKKARAFDAERDGGQDPLALKRAAKVEAATVADKWTFIQATESYVAAHAPSWKHPRARQVWLGPIVKYAYPVIGGAPLHSIKEQHVDAVMTAAVDGGAPQVAPRIRLRIEQILNAATALGRRNAELPNPASIKLIRAVRPAKREDERMNFRRIKLDDAPIAFQRLIEASGASTPLSALAFQISTATRPGEATGATWKEIDLDKRLWTVPAVRMKGGKGHAVPLSDLALTILERQQNARCGDAVFPSASGSSLSYGVFAAAARKLDFDVGTPHSWRSIFADAAADRLGVTRETREACLAHSLGKVEAAYRRETGVSARAIAMQKYADWLLGESADVITFPARA